MIDVRIRFQGSSAGTSGSSGFTRYLVPNSNGIFHVHPWTVRQWEKYAAVFAGGFG